MSRSDQMRGALFVHLASKRGFQSSNIPIIVMAVHPFDDVEPVDRGFENSVRALSSEVATLCASTPEETVVGAAVQAVKRYEQLAIAAKEPFYSNRYNKPLGPYREAATHFTNRAPLVLQHTEGFVGEQTIQGNGANDQNSMEQERLLSDRSSAATHKRTSPPPPTSDRARDGDRLPTQRLGSTGVPHYLSRPPTTCDKCSRDPATPVLFRRELGLIVFRYRYRVQATFCQPCGLEVFRSYTSRTLGLGWWGMFSFFTNFWSIKVNLASRSDLRALSPPTPRLESDQSRTVWRRPITYLPLVLFGLLGIIGVLTDPKPTTSNLLPKLTYFVGGCVGEESAGQYPPINCTSKSARFRITTDSPVNCPGMVLQNTSAKFCVAALEDSSSTDALGAVPNDVSSVDTTAAMAEVDTTVPADPTLSSAGPSEANGLNVDDGEPCVFVQLVSSLDYELEAKTWWSKPLQLEAAGIALYFATADELPSLSGRMMVVGSITPDLDSARVVIEKAKIVGISDAFARSFDSSTCSSLVSFDTLRGSFESKALPA